jgi:hypothetical protein
MRCSEIKKARKLRALKGICDRAQRDETLLDILNLLAHLFDQHFQLDG